MAGTSLDKIDRQILQLLADDGRLSYTKIGEVLNVTEGTVRNRVSRLQKTGVLTIKGIVDQQALGRTIRAMVGLEVNADLLPDIIETITGMKEIEHAVVTAGSYDLMLSISVSTTEELYDFLTNRLREIPGVNGSDTFVTLKVIKDRQGF